MLSFIIQKLKFLLFLNILIIFNLSIFAQSQETIDKCAKDLQSPKPEIRQQAAMILEKYQEPMVTELLFKHLKDESHLVRRAVLVSLQDRLQKRMVSISSMTEILDLLEDKDVEVRRLASTSAQFFIGLILREPFNIQNQRPTSPILLEERNKHKKKFINSMNDTDDIVRLNNLTTINQNRQFVNDLDFKNALLARIEDTNKSVIILTLELLQSQNNLDVKGIANKLVDNDQPDVAISLIKFLEMKRYIDVDIWNKLATRSNLEVSSKAIEIGFTLGIKDMDNKFSAFLLDTTNPVNQRVDFIHQLRLHPKRKELMAVLLEDKSNAIKLEIVKTLPQFLEQKELIKVLKNHMNDSSAAIKEEVSTLILQFATNADSDTLKLLFNSEKELVRLGVLEKIDILQINSDEILLEALIDDKKSIRLKAIEISGKAKRNNAQLKTMLIRSMDDEDPEIRTAILSVISIYVSEAEMLAIYKKLGDGEDVPVKANIANHLIKFSHPDAQTLLVKLSQDKSLVVSSQANLTLYLRGDKSKVEILAKNLLSDEIPVADRILLQQSIAKEKDQVHKTFGILLKDKSEVIRLACIKFFNLNNDLYQEEYFNAVFTETNNMIIQFQCDLYLLKKFHSLDIIKKAIASENQKIKMLGSRVIAENYNADFLPLLKELILSSDIRTCYLGIEVVKAKNLVELDTLIIDKLKAKPDNRIRTHLFFALLVLNTENANTYLKSITETNEMYQDLKSAQIRKKSEDSHPYTPGGKKR